MARQSVCPPGVTTCLVYPEGGEGEILQAQEQDEVSDMWGLRGFVHAQDVDPHGDLQGGHLPWLEALLMWFVFLNFNEEG